MNGQKIKFTAYFFPTENKKTTQPLPDFAKVHQELKRKGVTLMLLWYEYQQQTPGGYSYSRYCELYQAFIGKCSPSMRLTHRAGEKLFVDYSGLTVSWIDKATGESHKAQIFVAVLGASNYTFVEATADQSLLSWVQSHVHAFEFLAGVPVCLVPDNLRSGVTKAHLYDPDINRTYQDMADHYGVAVVPTRIRTPKDKPKVEVGVQGIQRWILAPLRDVIFFSVQEINDAIKPLLTAYNERAFYELEGSRRSQYLEVDKPALKALSATPYVYAEWKKARCGGDYHVAINKHYYSIPYQYISESIDVRITSTTIECFHKGNRIALHQRSYKPGHTTIHEHMPSKHQVYADWTPERMYAWAKSIGPNTAQLIEEACIEDIDYSPERQLSKTVITRLAECSWITKKENVLITGPTGAGKTYLACAFANQACRQGYGARYIRLPKLFQAITIAKADGSYIKLMDHVAKLSLLILDDWGLAPMTDANRRELLEIIDDRYQRSSTLITSQLPVQAWHDSVGDATLGDAILDRLVHNSHRIEVQGPSMRKIIAKKTHKKEIL